MYYKDKLRSSIRHYPGGGTKMQIKFSVCSCHFKQYLPIDKFNSHAYIYK